MDGRTTRGELFFFLIHLFRLDAGTSARARRDAHLFGNALVGVNCVNAAVA